MHLSDFTILTGFFLVLLGTPFLSKKESIRAKVLSFPRSRLLAYILMITGTCWFIFGHVMHLGEADFGEFKTIIVLISVCILILSFFLTKDFLAVRALSILTLLYSREVLDAAFLQEPSARLVLVSIIYIFISVALYLGAYPYRMRDFLTFVYSEKNRPKYVGFYFILCGLSVGFSVLSY